MNAAPGPQPRPTRATVVTMPPRPGVPAPPRTPAPPGHPESEEEPGYGHGV
jgi:hypothetical protein